MKCDRRWWNDGRLEREQAEHPSRFVPGHFAEVLELADDPCAWWDVGLDRWELPHSVMRYAVKARPPSSFRMLTLRYFDPV